MSKIPEKVRQRVRQRAGNRCEYCQCHQDIVMGFLQIDHVIPAAIGGSDHDDNLCLACELCNQYKWKKTDELDPEICVTILPTCSSSLATCPRSTLHAPCHCHCYCHSPLTFAPRHCYCLSPFVIRRSFFVFRPSLFAPRPRLRLQSEIAHRSSPAPSPQSRYRRALTSCAKFCRLAY